jgi:hypothetical protein
MGGRQLRAITLTNLQSDKVFVVIRRPISLRRPVKSIDGIWQYQKPIYKLVSIGYMCPVHLLCHQLVSKVSSRIQNRELRF